MIVGVALDCKVIHKRVQPHVDGLSVVSRHPDAPLQTTLRSRHRNLRLVCSQLCLHKVQDSRRDNTTGLLPRADCFCHCRLDFEDVVMLCDFLADFSSVRHNQVTLLVPEQILLHEECLFVGRVKTRVLALLDAAVGNESLPKVLDCSFVAAISCPHELVILDAAGVEQLSKHGTVLVAHFLRTCKACFGCLLLYFESMLVGPDTKKNLIAFKSFVAGRCVA